MSTLSIHNSDNDENESEDQLHQMRQRVRLVCEALRVYFKTHSILKANELRRTHNQEPSTASIDEGKVSVLMYVRMIVSLLLCPSVHDQMIY